MRGAMEYTNTETTYNCMQFPYLNYKLQNAKNQTFCNRTAEYGNLTRIIGSFRI